MAEYLIQDTTLTAIADAIRARANITGALTPEEFATAIESIPDYLALRANNDTPFSYHSEEVKRLYNDTFGGSNQIESVSVPNCKQIQWRALNSCSRLTSVYAPNALSIESGSFSGSSALPRLKLPSASSIYDSAFKNCTALAILVLGRTDNIVELRNINAFAGTPIESGTGYVYVPSALVDTYKADSVWSTYANQIRAIEDYPDIVEGWDS